MHTDVNLILKIISDEFSFDLGEKKLSKYLKLSSFIRDKIEHKIFPNAYYLPSTRVLANTLNISRSTVIKAYEQLQFQGLIKSKTGSGFQINNKQELYDFENKIKRDVEYPEISKKGKLFLKNVSLIHSTDEKFVGFRPGLPPLDVFPVNQWKRLSNLYWRHIKYSSLSFSDSSGIEVLKKNIAKYLNLTRGLNCDHHQIVIVSGSLQSLYLIGNALLNSGDTMVMENPTFPNVNSIFRSLDANIKPIAVDNNGIKIKELNLSPNENPKLIHLTPSNHYPTGVRMSLKRKQEILKWAEKHQSIIIENDFDHEISNWETKNDSIFSLDKQQRTIFLGTFNRLLHQSVRLGYMVVPYYLLDTIKALQKHSHRFVSPSNQVVMSQFIEKNHLYNHIKNVINIASKRQSVFIESFKKHIHPSMTIMPSQANSLHILTEIPDSISDTKLTESLSKNNIIAHQYSKCFVKGQKQGLIFGYSCVKKPLIENKIKTISKIYNEFITKI